jgi:hypothetical protein
MEQQMHKIKPANCIIGLSVFFSAITMVVSSCKKLVSVPEPLTEIAAGNVFTDDRSATSAIVGIYSDMMSSQVFAGLDIGYFCALSADELIVLLSSSNELQQFQSNSLISTNTTLLGSFWEPGYRYIWYANSAIEGLEKSASVSHGAKKQLLAEAKFIRAFCHFYLTALFGDIPYITSTDYRVNATATKISRSEVYNKIINDLSEAQSNISVEYVTSERVRPNRAAVSALLARVYLYTQDWSNAEIQATSIINDSKYQLEADLTKIFLATSKEAIWQLMPVNPGHNSYEISYITSGSNGGLTLTDQLLNAFEGKDKRDSNWVKSWTNADGTITNYYPFKYKVASLNQPVTEYNMVFRLAEQFLIRSEARARQNNLTGANSAESDLNLVRNRAGLDNTTALTQQQMLEAILQERRVELFSEWGHRWFDLQRMDKADAVLGPVKMDWEPTDKLFPLPQLELDKNKNLLPQNEGYQ